jgi:NAD(P)-dependent dehydrogenase (short-subunit alcohol dehydrogenase family)
MQKPSRVYFTRYTPGAKSGHLGTRSLLPLDGAVVAFNNAGILGEKGPTTGISLDGWNETLKVNLTSAFLAAN